jgi:hypothetical protein
VVGKRFPNRHNRTRSDRTRTPAAVVGLGYRGPNLLRVLGDHLDLDVEVRWICDWTMSVQ